MLLRAETDLLSSRSQVTITLKSFWTNGSIFSPFGCWRTTVRVLDECSLYGPLLFSVTKGGKLPGDWVLTK